MALEKKKYTMELNFAMNLLKKNVVGVVAPEKWIYLVLSQSHLSARANQGPEKEIHGLTALVHTVVFVAGQPKTGMMILINFKTTTSFHYLKSYHKK